MSTITTHVLDTSRGLPAADLPVRLERVDGAAAEPLGEAVTDADGRVTALGPAQAPAGHYRLVFGTGAYFAATGRETFYPHVTVDFDLVHPDRHHHVPLLLSPYGFTTYRGS